MQKIHSGPPSPKCRALSIDAAETMAIEVLNFLVQDQAHLERFLALSGLNPCTLRAASKEPQFGAALLGYLVSDEAALVAFAASSGHEPSAAVRARDLLSPQKELP